MPKEFDIIDYFKANNNTNSQNIIKGPGDDMAVLALQHDKILITADTLLEGVHFDLSKASLEQVGYKAMACSLSDCAAMCSTPIGAIGCTSFPTSFNMDDIKQMHKGVQYASDKYNCPIIGGDVTSWDNPLAISITMFSIMENGRMPVYRSGAKIGDKILVTGKLGGTISGKHLTFSPRIEESHWLYDNCQLNSLMDISDGTAGDLRHICTESNVSAFLYADRIPVNNTVISKDRVMGALTDGEDFELLMTIPEKGIDELLLKWSAKFDTPLTVIGEIIEKDNNVASVFLKRENQIDTIQATGWEHKTS